MFDGSVGKSAEYVGGCPYFLETGYPFLHLLLVSFVSE